MTDEDQVEFDEWCYLVVRALESVGLWFDRRAQTFLGWSYSLNERWGIDHWRKTEESRVADSDPSVAEARSVALARADHAARCIREDRIDEAVKWLADASEATYGIKNARWLIASARKEPGG